MPLIQAIFFDIGDTLVFDNPPLQERLWQAMEKIGLSADKARLPQAFRQGERYAVRRYVAGLPWDDPDVLRETITRILAVLDLPPLDERLHKELVAAFGAISFQRYAHSEAIPLLRELRQRGFILGGISDWADTLPDLLTELQIAPFLSALAVSDIVGARKPHRLLFEEALRQAAVPAANALHIGDWYELDVCGARTVGMQTLLFDWMGRAPDADCPRVTSFAELNAYLLALPMPEKD